MGIKLNVPAAKQDYSNLLSSMGSAGGAGNWLGDYAMIKNGSYGKLMKSYYSENKASASADVSSQTTSAASKKRRSGDVLEQILEEKKHPKVSKETQKANDNLTAGLPSLNSSVAALQSDKTYTDTANGQSAADKVVSAMKSYVSNYNSVVTAAKGSTLTNKTSYVANMMSKTASSVDQLSEIGVTVNSNGTLLLDEAKLKKADISKVQELFSSKDITSYGSSVASRLQFAGAASGSSAAESAGTDAAASSGAAALKADGKTLASDALYAGMKDQSGNDTGKYDVDKIFAAANSFVSNYNRMFDAAEPSANSGVSSNLSYIREKTAANADTLKQFGISVNEKGRMKMEESVFRKADMSQVQKFFKDYGSSVATNASLVDYYITTQASAADGYTSSGTYNAQGSARYADTM